MITIYEHCNPATTTLLHVIRMKKEGDKVKGFGKLISKQEGDNSKCVNAEYLNFDFDQDYFNDCYKVYEGGRKYISMWEKPKEFNEFLIESDVKGIRYT